MEKYLSIIGLVLLLMVIDVSPASLSDKKEEQNAVSSEQEVVNAEEESTENKTVILPIGNEHKDCPPYPYCDGERFGERLDIGERRILCDQVPHPLNFCCLPTSKHLVCYNVMVEGQQLNFDRDDPRKTTHFTDLCEEMIRAANSSLIPGPYTAVNPAKNGGGVVYRYDQWVDIDTSQDKEGYHIQDIACGIIN